MVKLKELLVELTPYCAKAEWLTRFDVALRQHVPSVPTSAGRQVASRDFEEAADLSPEEAARIYAAEPEPPHVGSPE